MTALTVVIVDDHPVFRRGLTSLLETAGMVVLAQAVDGVGGIAAVKEHRPDVVLMDLHLPDINGAEATRRLVRDVPGVQICILTMFDDDDSVFASMRAGALGYLLKGTDIDGIERAVRAVTAGEALYSAAVARRMQAFFAAASSGGLAVQPFPELTPREREVLEHVARGESNAEIAAALDLAQKTVRNVVSAVLAKLRVVDRGQAIVRARDAGLGRG
ncbi:putative two-component system response regulator, LuxR family [Arthrobacter sp. PAMC 25486]|uniref:response regulator transcription factor n=1 Tax=Arthrobacter sp. PAMC 25486 TaxID=1494608 RepID=UPI000535C4BB|nr:response regulator transcription factor [Arthrobacter sp. PAMC 25486]AIY03270.1 putative two-component system response regulator, LuxR family [Arthrobacter sp. PAMC 25486]